MSDFIDKLQSHRRRTRPDHRRAGQASLPHRLARELSRRGARRRAAGDDRGSGRRRKALRRREGRDRAAGRQHRHDGRRHAAPAGPRDRAVAQPHEPHRRGRSHRLHHDGRGGRRAQDHPGDGRPARPAVSAEPRRRGQLHHRRQPLDQCRRRAGAALRQCPPARARAGGGDAAGRGVERPARAQEGQHRLRPARPLSRRRGHARHHHQGDPEALAQAQGRRDLVDRRALARGRGGAAERRARRQRGQRHLLRADGPPGRRPRAAAHPGLGRSAGRAARLVRAAGMVVDPAAPRRRQRDRASGEDGSLSRRGHGTGPGARRGAGPERGAGPRLLGPARKPLGIPEARRPVDQARHLGVGEQDPCLHDGRPCRR